MMSKKKIYKTRRYYPLASVRPPAYLSIVLQKFFSRIARFLNSQAIEKCKFLQINILFIGDDKFL